MMMTEKTATEGVILNPIEPSDGYSMWFLEVLPFHRPHAFFNPEAFHTPEANDFL